MLLSFIVVLAAGTALGRAGEYEALLEYLKNSYNSSNLGQVGTPLFTLARLNKSMIILTQSPVATGGRCDAGLHTMLPAGGRVGLVRKLDLVNWK
jgi:hypothetical protein